MAGPGARFWLALLVFLMPLGTRVRAQEPPGPVAPSPVPLASIAEAAAQARSWLKEVDSETLQATDPALLQADLLDWSLRLDRHLQENERILLDQPPLEVLRAREAALAQLSTPLETWRNLLSKRSELLENQAARLGVLRESWRATAAEAREKGSSQALVEEIDQVLASLEAATLRVQDHQARILDLQGQAALQEDRLARAASGLSEARESARDRALMQDSPPLWKPGGLREMLDMQYRIGSNLRAQSIELQTFLRAGSVRLGFLLVVFGLVFLGLRRVQRHLQPQLLEEPCLHQLSHLLKAPVPVAMLVTVAFGGLTDLQAPDLFLGLLGAVVLVPTLLILRVLLEPYLLPLLRVVALLFVLDLVRVVAQPVPTLDRLVLLAQTVLALLVLVVWFLRPARWLEVPVASREAVRARAMTLARVAAAILAASTLANLLGFVALADLLGTGSLRCTYAGLVLAAGSRILQGLVAWLLYVRPLCESQAVRKNRPLMVARLGRAIQLAAMLVWGLVALEAFSLHQQVLGGLGRMVRASVALGSFRLSLADLLVFALSLWLAVQLSRFVRFVLDEDVFPRLQFKRGTGNALSLTLHYAILLFGFLFALAAVGLDLTRLTVLLGALGVGIGFGLQNIVNNFVSGLILLFDPSLSLGDPIQFGAHQGELVHIGLRASTVRLYDGRDLVVPNSELISQQVINGSASNLQPRRIELDFALVGPLDAQAVLDLARQAAQEHPDVAREPAPLALSTGFQEGSPRFVLQVWVHDPALVLQVRSDLAMALGEAIQKAGYRVAGPRREVRVAIRPDRDAPPPAGDSGPRPPVAG